MHSRLVVDAPLALDRPDLYEERMGLEMHDVTGVGTHRLDPLAERWRAFVVAASRDAVLASLVVVKQADSVSDRNGTGMLGLRLAPLALRMAEHFFHFVEEFLELGNAAGHGQLVGIYYGKNTAKAILAQRRSTLWAHHGPRGERCQSLGGWKLSV